MFKVVLVGSITFAEISALRYLSNDPKHLYNYIICTTKLINGTSFIESIKENIQNNVDVQSVLPL